MARALVNIPSSGTIGEVKASMMTLAQFQAQFGTNWVLANGASATGTKYATITGNTTLPDCRGVALRGKDNGRGLNPDGDIALGTYQADLFGSHDHGGGSHAHTTTPLGGDGAVAGGQSAQRTTNVFTNPITSPSGTIIATQGGNETRMKSVTVNYFIKVN